MNDKINYRKKVPCFGNNPSTDIMLMSNIVKRQIKIQKIKNATLNIGIYASSALIVTYIIKKFYELIR